MLTGLLVFFGPVLGSIVLAVVLERLSPARAHNSDGLRPLHSAVLYILGVIGVFLIVPTGHIGVILFVSEHEFGLLQWIGLGGLAATLFGIVLLDLSEWLAHYLLHRLPLLWRMHKVHHSDLTMDISTGYRFHPLETILRFLIGVGFVLIFGLPESSVVIYGITVLAFNTWEHANVDMPPALRPLQTVIITPELHRVHHSRHPDHIHSNFGVLLAIWDRVFGTFVVADAPDELEYGLVSAEESPPDRLGDLLAAPIRKGIGPGSSLS